MDEIAQPPKGLDKGQSFDMSNPTIGYDDFMELFRKS
jgi:hypothetical protein